MSCWGTRSRSPGRAARRILERDDVLEVIDERVQARHPASRRALEEAIQSAIGVRDTDDKPTEPEYIFKLWRIGEGRAVEMLVKRVMCKCGASSQVELVGLLQRSLVRLA